MPFRTEGTEQTRGAPLSSAGTPQPKPLPGVRVPRPRRARGSSRRTRAQGLLRLRGPGEERCVLASLSDPLFYTRHEAPARAPRLRQKGRKKPKKKSEQTNQQRRQNPQSRRAPAPQAALPCASRVWSLFWPRRRSAPVRTRGSESLPYLRPGAAGGGFRGARSRGGRRGGGGGAGSAAATRGPRGRLSILRARALPGAGAGGGCRALSPLRASARHLRRRLAALCGARAPPPPSPKTRGASLSLSQ